MNLLAPLSIGFALVSLQAMQAPPSDSPPVPDTAPQYPTEPVAPPPATMPSVPPAPDPDAERVMARCTTCHPATRFDSKHLTQDQWQAVVTRMISFGARVTPDEEPTIVAWLASHHGPEDMPAAPAEDPANGAEAQ